MSNQQLNISMKSIIAATLFVLSFCPLKTLPAQVVECPLCSTNGAAFDEIRAWSNMNNQNEGDISYYPNPAVRIHQFDTPETTVQVELSVSTPNDPVREGDEIEWTMTVTHMGGAAIGLTFGLKDTQEQDHGPPVYDSQFVEGESYTLQGSVTFDLSLMAYVGNIKEYGVGGTVLSGEPGGPPTPLEILEMYGFFLLPRIGGQWTGPVHCRRATHNATSLRV